MKYENEDDETFEIFKRAWNIMLCKSALEALVKYGAPKSEYDELKKAANESNSRRVKKHK